MSIPLEFAVHAGPHRRELCPLGLPLSEPISGPFHLIDTEKGHDLPVQLDMSDSNPTLAVLLNTLQAGESRTYRLQEGESPREHVRVELVDQLGEKVDISIGGKPFTSYHYGGNWVRPFFYPVIGPYDARVTRGYPVAEIPCEKRDHPHHKSIWIAHGEVSGVDNWSEEPGHGWQIHQEFCALESGPVFGRISERLKWMDNARGETQLVEDRQIRVYALPDHMRLMDFQIRLTTQDKPVLLGDTKEAGILSVRVASSMDGAVGGRIETGSGAIGEGESWGRKAPWCSYSGPVATSWGELWAGIALFDHPENLRYPTNWHVRDYGLMTANCFGQHDFFNRQDRPGEHTIPAGESLTFRYRLYIHAGDAIKGGVANKYQDFANPPTAKLR